MLKVAFGDGWRIRNEDTCSDRRTGRQTKGAQRQRNSASNTVSTRYVLRGGCRLGGLVVWVSSKVRRRTTSVG